jgi:hypothetical protein
MSHDLTEQPAEGVQGSGVEERQVEALSPGQANGPPSVTFRGNTYDLISLGSLISGALLLFSCLTCNTGYYCLPLLSIALGAIGVLSARQSVEAQRTRLWSWLGIAAGGIVLLLIVLLVVCYIGFIVLAVATEEWGRPR